MVFPSLGPDEGKPSAFVELVGGRLEERGEGYMRLSLDVEEHHTNPTGVMHGGVLTTLMDEAIGGAIAMARGMEVMMQRPHATIEMNVSFLAGARPGDRVVVEGRVLRLGGSVCFGEAEARLGDGELMGKARMTFAILRRDAK